MASKETQARHVSPAVSGRDDPMQVQFSGRTARPIPSTAQRGVQPPANNETDILADLRNTPIEDHGSLNLPTIAAEEAAKAAEPPRTDHFVRVPMDALASLKVMLPPGAEALDFREHSHEHGDRYVEVRVNGPGKDLECVIEDGRDEHHGPRRTISWK